jgi:hypothetical protein
VLVRGKYTERLRQNSNVVVIDPEVAELFPNGASVNAALRALAEVAKREGAMRKANRGKRLRRYRSLRELRQR